MIPGLSAQLMPKGKEVESAQRINRFMHMMDRMSFISPNFWGTPPPTHARTRARTQARTSFRTHERTHERTHACMNAYTHTHTLTRMHARAFARTNARAVCSGVGLDASLCSLYEAEAINSKHIVALSGRIAFGCTRNRKFIDRIGGTAHGA